MKLAKYQIKSIANIVRDKLIEKINDTNEQLIALNKKEIASFKKDILKNDDVIKDAKKVIKLIDKITSLYKKIYELRDKITKNSNYKLYMYNYLNKYNKKLVEKYIQSKVEHAFLIPTIYKNPRTLKTYMNNSNKELNIEDFIVAEDIFSEKDLAIDKLVDKLIIKILKENDNNR